MTNHLFVLQPRVIVTGQVAATFVDEYPLSDVPTNDVVVNDEILTFDQIVKAGQTVIFGSTPGGDDKGRQRIRRVFDDSVLLIGLSSEGTRDGEVDLEIGDYFEIWDDYRIWSKVQRFYKQDVLPFSTIYKDADEIFASHGTGLEFYPKANSGPARAGFIDSITGLLTVEFPGPEGVPSYSMPAGVGIATYDWNVQDGTITVGTSASSEITATFPAGFRWISLTVTDTNGFSHTMRTPVLADDPNDSLCVSVWQVDSWDSEQKGQRLSFKIFSSLPRSAYPDGTLVLMFDDANVDHYCNFYGWHHTDRANLEFVKTGALKDTILECVDGAGKLDTLPGQSQIIASKEVPATWPEMYHPTMYLMIDFILRWHSTALDILDFIKPFFEANYAFISRESQADSLWSQVQEQARSIVPDHMITCNREGQLRMERDPFHEHPSLRTSTVQATLTGKISRIAIPHERPPRVHWIKAGAVVEGWAPIETEIEVEYTIRPDGEVAAGVTTIPVLPLPTDIPDGAMLDYKSLGIYFIEVTADAIEGATSIDVVTTTEILFPWDHLLYTATEDGPSYIPTQFCVSPGVVHGQGVSDLTINNKITQSDATLRSCIANMYERLNSEYDIIDIDLIGNDDLGIDPAELTWIRLGAISSVNIPQRALPILSTNPRLLPLSVSRKFRYGKEGRLADISIRAEIETGTAMLAVSIDGSEF